MGDGRLSVSMGVRTLQIAAMDEGSGCWGGWEFGPFANCLQIGPWEGSVSRVPHSHHPLEVCSECAPFSGLRRTEQSLTGSKPVV